ncbi:MAG TPA: Lin1244/Lin1753 domain-containing protein [Ignavibacteriales bacterium]|nr:Lin1244/Lin1753 domain-containing protein [Ignavibacteriales bacterium]
MKEDAIYFQHDSNARRDPKIIALIADYGFEGYGRFWAIIEFLREQKGCMRKDKNSMRALAYELRMDTSAAEKFMDDLIHEYDLLSLEEDFIFSRRLNKSIDHLDTIREKRKEAIRRRWNKLDDTKVPENDTNVSKTDTIVPENDTKESKGKETIVKDSIVNNNIIINTELSEDTTEEVASSCDEAAIDIPEGEEHESKKKKKDNFLNEVMDIFCEEYEKSRNMPYIITAPGKERQAIGTLLKIYKAKNKEGPKRTREETLRDFRIWFQMCLGIEEDHWLYKKMSPSIISSNYNEIKTVLKKGRRGENGGNTENRSGYTPQNGGRSGGRTFGGSSGNKGNGETKFKPGTPV